MRTLALVSVLLLQAQEKVPVRLTPGVPDEKGWELKGAIDRPDDTELQVASIRVERRWDLRSRRFNEHLPPETRVFKTAEVNKKAFTVSLPNQKASPVGVYKLTVTDKQKGGLLHTERAVRGRADDLFQYTGKQMPRLVELPARLSSYIDVIEQVSRDKKLATKQNEDAFKARVLKDDLIVRELSERVDLSATLLLLREAIGLILSAQVWPRPNTEAANNDTDLIFVDPAMTFGTLRDFIRSVPSVLSTELRASAGTILEEMLRRAEERPDRHLSAAKRAAQEALKCLKEAPEEEKVFDELLKSIDRADEKTVSDTLKSLQTALSSLVSRP